MLANMNGTLVETPVRNSRASESPKESTETGNVALIRSHRRDTFEWTLTPAVRSSSDGPSPSPADDETMILSPVTPAHYGDNAVYGAETPCAATPYFFHKENLVQKTAPVQKYHELAEVDGSLPVAKEASVMVRLMAARRKSLQWAPKVGSPLARDL